MRGRHGLGAGSSRSDRLRVLVDRREADGKRVVRPCFCWCVEHCAIPCTELTLRSCDRCPFADTLSFAAWRIRLNAARIVWPLVDFEDRMLAELMR